MCDCVKKNFLKQPYGSNIIPSRTSTTVKPPNSGHALNKTKHADKIISPKCDSLC